MTVTEAPAAAGPLRPSPLATRPAPKPVRRHRRGLLFSYLLTVIVLLAVNFFLPRAMPGDPIDALTGTSSSTHLNDPALRSRVARYYGLDRPLVNQFGHYVAGLARGDLGFSIRYNVPVAHLVLSRMRWTVLLVLTSMLMAVSIGMIAGIHSGWRRGRGLDRRLLGLFIVVGNFPVFVVAAFALIVFSVKLGWFPLNNSETRFAHFDALHHVVDLAHHVILPASVMALQFVFLEYLVMRGGMVSELGSDYLLLGRAKGISERGLKYRYAARNALLPVVTVVALDLRSMVAATVFVETVFAYPGLGRLMFDSIDARDYPTMQASFLVISLLVVSINLVTDLVYPRLDPRVAR